MEELWKDIPGYEGLYQASTDGRIRTAEGKTTSNARFPVRVWKQRIIKQKYEKRKSGEYRDARVCLWKNGTEKTFLVSRLVALAWVDGYQEGYTVNHIDGNPLNNCVENLEWISRADNIRHGFENGAYHKNQKPCTLINQNGEKFEFPSLRTTFDFLGKKYYRMGDIKDSMAVISSTGEPYTMVRQSV